MAVVIWKRVRAGFAIALLMALLSAATAFADITVTKHAQTELSVGERIDIYLEIRNTYDEDVPVTIKDSNILSGNGLVIKCMESLVPAGETIRVDYDSLQLFKRGTYELGPANISFTAGGSEQTVSSNPLEVRVIGDDSGPGTQSITEIYKCGGVSSTSTRFASGGGSSMSAWISGSNGGSSISFNMGGGSLGGFGSQGGLGNSIGTGEVLASHKDPFIETIKNDSDFISIETRLVNNGFILQHRSTNKSSESTGSFDFTYLNGERERHLIGEVVDGDIVSIIEKNDNFRFWLAKALGGLFSVLLFALFAYLVHAYIGRKVRHGKGSPGRKRDGGGSAEKKAAGNLGKSKAGDTGASKARDTEKKKAGGERGARSPVKGMDEGTGESTGKIMARDARPSSAKTGSFSAKISSVEDAYLFARKFAERQADADPAVTDPSLLKMLEGSRHYEPLRKIFDEWKKRFAGDKPDMRKIRALVESLGHPAGPDHLKEEISGSAKEGSSAKSSAEVSHMPHKRNTERHPKERSRQGGAGRG